MFSRIAAKQVATVTPRFFSDISAKVRPFIVKVQGGKNLSSDRELVAEISSPENNKVHLDALQSELQKTFVEVYPQSVEGRPSLIVFQNKLSFMSSINRSAEKVMSNMGLEPEVSGVIKPR